MREQTLRIWAANERELVTIINVYAPHSGIVSENPEELQNFYNELDQTYRAVLNDSTLSQLIICGDFNSRVGKSGAEECVGSYVKGSRNENGKALVDFCTLNNLFISNTAFEHPMKHIRTW